MRRFTASLATFALVLGLFGAGISATFSDSATAQMTVHVGTFNIDMTSAQGVVACSPGPAPAVCTVTYDAGTILSSAAGSKPFAFTVTSTGSIPALIQVAASSPAAPFADLLAPTADFTLNQGESHVFNAGLSWSELSNAQLGMDVSITYTITASA
jgi:hypothetical protein